MAEFRWIKVSLFLMLLLQFTAVTGQYFSLTVRVGDEVTLPCENVIRDQDKCDSTTWTFSGSGNTAAVELIALGQIGAKAKAKSDRLSVTANCSLVIKKVTVEDAGHYDCQQYNKSGRKQAPDSHVHLSVINITARKALPVPLSTSSPPSSPEEPGEDATATRSISTAAPTTLTPTAEARTDCSALNYVMLVMRAAELVLITVITVVLIRARGNQRAPADNTVCHDGDGRDDTANYENVGGPHASIRFQLPTSTHQRK